MSIDLAALVGKHVFYPRSERTDQFRNKRYTNPEAERWRHITIKAKVIGFQGNQLKLAPTETIPDVPEQFVIYDSELALVSDTLEIRTLEDHGDIAGCNVWREDR